MSDGFDWLNAAQRNSGNPVEDVQEENKEMLREAAQRQREEAMLFFNVFGTRAGMMLLAHLRESTIELPMLVVNGTIEGGRREVPLNPHEWMFVREGQNSVVRHIENMMRIASASEQEEETTNEQ